MQLHDIVIVFNKKNICCICNLLQGIRVFKESIVSVDLDFMVPGYPFKNDVS